MITEKEIIKILKGKNLLDYKTWGDWYKAIAKAIIDKIIKEKENGSK